MSSLPANRTSDRAATNCKRQAQRVIILVGALPPPFSGQTLCFDLLIRGFAQRDIEYHVVNLSESRFERFIGRFTVKRALQTIISILRFARLAIGRRRVTYLTIAQSKVGFIRDFWIIWLAWLCRHRLVLHLKGGGFGRFYEELPGWQRWIVGHTWKRASVIIILGESLRQMFVSEPDLSTRLRVIPNALPNENDELPHAGKALPSDRPARILYLSNLIESKGYLHLLEATSLLVNERGYAIEAHFCGEFVPETGHSLQEMTDRQRREFFAQVAAKGLAQQVHYHGVVSGEEKQAMLRQSEFFVLPTQYKNEGQPVSIIEAMAYGLVVLACPIAAIPEMLGYGESGTLISPDARAIADRLEHYLRHPEEYRAISDAAVQKYHRSYTQSAHLNAIIPCILGSGDSQHAVQA